MSNEEILAELNKGMTALHNGIRNVNQALSSANIAVGQAGAYNKGVNDAWGFVKKIHEMGYRNVIEVFPDINGLIGCEIVNIVEKYTPQEALAKLESYEKKKAEIKVGDIYEVMGCFCVIAQVDEFNEEYNVIWESGITDRIPFEAPIGFKKTGKNIDIQSVLEQIGGDSDD